MNDTPTPRTQAAIRDWINKGEIAILIDISDELETELTAARAEIDEIHATGGCSYIELHKVTEQRDEARECLKRCARAHGELGASQRNQIVKVENQRDRLAEALEQIANINLDKCDDDAAIFMFIAIIHNAKQVLQSLTPTQTEPNKL